MISTDIDFLVVVFSAQPQEDILEGIDSSISGISCITHLLLELYLLDSPRLSSLVKEHYRTSGEAPYPKIGADSNWTSDSRASSPFPFMSAPSLALKPHSIGWIKKIISSLEYLEKSWWSSPYTLEISGTL